MIRAPARASLILTFLFLVAALAAAAVFDRRDAKPPPVRADGAKPTLLLLTSLPLMFGEGFSIRGTGSPALTQLMQRYRVVPISVTDPAELAKGKLLLMAHPLAQPAEDLVALDQWVRGGGRVLLLADPMLEWPSNRPLGDPLRPPPMFMDTGLLAHWGLRLDAPDERGPKQLRLAGYDVLTASPGRLSGRCPVSADWLVAYCNIGAGRATIIADADLLDVGDLDGPTSYNLNAVIEELANLDHR